ncbi:MAG: hypothetical protein J1F42_02475 [Lachnospiraceae bacterium]|nr:hypothetical protein [Lachnospiraceae bacterium]
MPSKSERGKWKIQLSFEMIGLYVNMATILKRQNEVFNRLSKINKKYRAVKISDIGCFEIKYDDINRVVFETGTSREIINIFFRRIDDKVALSRNAIYYDFKAFHSYSESFVRLLTKTVEIYDTDKSVSYVLSALLDYYENYQVTYWYALFECSIDNIDIQDELYDYCKKIKYGLEQLIIFHLNMYDEDGLNVKSVIEIIINQWILIKTSWILAESRAQLIFRLFREFDNRIKCINEIVYDIYALERDGIKVDNLFMPLYGASMLAMYASPVLEYFDIKKDIKVGYARIGFHDLLPLELSVDYIKADETKIAPAKYLAELKEGFKGRITLVIDDNVGYGMTINCCKKMIELYDGTCYTRTAETSWDKIFQSDIALTIDYPGIFSYLRYTQQQEYIEHLKNKAVYTREFEYKKNDRYIDTTKIDRGELNNIQIERMKREYEIKQQLDVVDFSLGMEVITCLNRINIDILNGKCTADETLDIIKTIEDSLDKHMEICIVDLNKSIYGESSNEINTYLLHYPNRLWVAGGIMSLSEAETLIQSGAKGVVIGSAIYRDGNVDVDMVKELINQLGKDRVYFSLDYLGENIVVRGFEEMTRIKLANILQIFETLKCNVNVILVDVDASKNNATVDFERILRIKREYEHISFYYGGNLTDYGQVRRLNNSEIGAILGKNYIKRR